MEMTMTVCVVVLVAMLMSAVEGTQFSLGANWSVTNNGSLDQRVKSGDINRVVFIEDNDNFALVFLDTSGPNSYVAPNATFYLSIVISPYSYAVGTPFSWNPVWVANREHPVQQNATLSLQSNGDLVLRDADGTPVWCSNTTNVVSLDLQSDGNIVLRDASNASLWESFDSPADAILPGQVLKSPFAQLTSATSGRNYSAGNFHLAAAPGGLLLINQSTPYVFKSAEAKNDSIYAVLHTCAYLNDLVWVAGEGLVIRTDTRTDEQVVDPTLCGQGDSTNGTLVLGAASSQEFSSNQFVRIDPDGVLRLYAYSTYSRSYKIISTL